MELTIFASTQNLDYNVYVVTPGFLNQSTVDCSQNTSMYYEALTPQSLDYYTTKYLQNPLRWEAGSPGYNSYSSDDDFSQAVVCNISKALLADSTAGTLSRLSNEDFILRYGSGNGNTKGWAIRFVVTKDRVTLPYVQFRYQEYVLNYTVKDWVCDSDYLIHNNYRYKYRHFAQCLVLDPRPRQCKCGKPIRSPLNGTMAH
jgi:hypothetical protein